jgi:two-component system LytT family sensor kinase
MARPRRRATAAREADLLALLTEALPHLRTGLAPEGAQRVAELLCERLDVAAASFVDTEHIVAFAGVGADHHRPGQIYSTALTRAVLHQGRPQHTRHREEIGCPVPSCPLTTAAVAPLRVDGRVVGALKLYQTGEAALGQVEMRIADGLARLFGVYLELAEMETRAARVVEAELEALRAQISPHFLFNTLNAIAALTRIDPEKAHDTLIEFSEFFRETLRKHDELWPLRLELEHVEHYLNLERARLGERLAVEYAIEPACTGAAVPALVVQPLVENAVIHGLEPKLGPGRITIGVRRAGDEVEIAVEDDGVGVPPDRMAQIFQPGYGTGLGIGLSNVDRRLRGLFGPEFGLRIESRAGGGTRAVLRVPEVDGLPRRGRGAK